MATKTKRTIKKRVKSKIKKKVAPKKRVTKRAPKTAPAKKSPSPRTTQNSSRSIDALAKKVATVSSDTRSLSKNLKVVVKIFGDNQKILVSMKTMIDELVGALDAIQKQSKRIGALETDTQQIFDGMGEMRIHSRMIAKLDTQSAKLHDAIRAIDDRTHASDGINSVSKKVDENHDSIKNNAQMIIKIGRHMDKLRDDLSGSSVRASSIKDIHTEIARLKLLFEQAQTKPGADASITAEISALSQKVDALSQIPVKISSVQKRLQELPDVNDVLGPIVGELKDQISDVASKIDSPGSLGSMRDELASLRDEVLGRASKVDLGIESVFESLGRSEKSVTEFHKKVDSLFEELRNVKGAEERTSGESTSEVMALLRLSEFQSNVRMTAESKYGEVSDLEAIAAQTVDVLNIFDKLAVETGSEVRLPQGIKQWAVSKILECSDRWEIRFSDVLNVLREKLGVSLLKESVRMSQVREIYGARAVDELESVFGEK